MRREGRRGRGRRGGGEEGEASVEPAKTQSESEGRASAPRTCTRSCPRRTARGRPSRTAACGHGLERQRGTDSRHTSGRASARRPAARDGEAERDARLEDLQVERARDPGGLLRGLLVSRCSFAVREREENERERTVTTSTAASSALAALAPASPPAVPPRSLTRSCSGKSSVSVMMWVTSAGSKRGGRDGGAAAVEDEVDAVEVVAVEVGAGGQGEAPQVVRRSVSCGGWSRCGCGSVGERRGRERGGGGRGCSRQRARLGGRWW